MTQFARPIQDITSSWAALNWTDGANLWGSLAEPIADDSRGIRTGNNPSGVEYECLLSRIGAPADASDLTLKVRLLCSAGTADVVTRLRQGTTEIAVTTHAVTTTATTFSLSVPVASITDYTDLRTEVVATKTSGGSMSVRCFWVELSGADDDAPAFVDELRALTPWALYRFREGGGAVANDDVANAHMAAADGQGTSYAARPTFGLATFLPDGSDTAAAFDGVNDEVESAGFTSYNGDGSIVLLLRGGVVANRASNETLFRCQSAGVAGLIALQWGASGQYVLHWRDDAGSGTFTDLWTPAEDEVDLLFFVTNGTDLRVFRNGSTTAEFTTTAQTAQGHDEIGVGANKTSDALAEFDIQTLGVYRSALTEANRLDIHAAFAGAGGPAEGTATVAHSWAVSAVGERTSAGSASTTHTWAAVAAGEALAEGSATATHAWGQSATGDAPTGESGGSATVAHMWASSAAGAATHQGDATTSHTWAASATGAAVHEGTTTTGHAWAVSAVGETPVEGVSDGTASVTHSWTTMASGEREPVGSASTTHVWAITAAGDTPTVDERSGTATAAYAWTASAVGVADHRGLATTSHVWTVVVGEPPSSGREQTGRVVTVTQQAGRIVVE